MTAVSASITKVQIFTEEPSKSFTGMVPAYLSHIGKMDNGTIVACFKFLNKISLKSASLQKIVKNGELCCITYNKGKIEDIAVYQVWVDQFVVKKASGVILSTGGEEFEARKDVGISKISLESYNKMIRLVNPLFLTSA